MAVEGSRHEMWVRGLWCRDWYWGDECGGVGRRQRYVWL